MMVHHYAPGTHALAVIESGYVDTTPQVLRKFEKGIAWFSTMDEFPKTAWKPVELNDGSLRVLTPDEMADMLGGIYRFSCNENSGKLMRWDMLKSLARIPMKVRKRLVRRAKDLGENPSSWRGSLEKVPTSMLNLQKWDGSEWVDVPMDVSSVSHAKVRIQRKALD